MDEMNNDGKTLAAGETSCCIAEVRFLLALPLGVCKEDAAGYLAKVKEPRLETVINAGGDGPFLAQLSDVKKELTLDLGDGQEPYRIIRYGFATRFPMLHALADREKVHAVTCAADMWPDYSCLVALLLAELYDLVPMYTCAEVWLYNAEWGRDCTVAPAVKAFELMGVA